VLMKTTATLMAVLCLSLTGTAWAATPAPGVAAPAPAASSVNPHGGPMGSMTRAKPKAAPPVAPAKLVDINSASKAELKTLPGIGDAEADRIIKNRPYLSKTELVGKRVLLEGPYLSLRHKVIAFQKGRTKVAKQTTRAAPVSSVASAPRKP
jgi:competence protein ComEA